MSETIDRPIMDIVQSVQKAIADKKIQGQLARDLDKLCAVAYRTLGNDKAVIDEFLAAVAIRAGEIAECSDDFNDAYSQAHNEIYAERYGGGE